MTTAITKAKAQLGKLLEVPGVSRLIDEIDKNVEKRATVAAKYQGVIDSYLWGLIFEAQRVLDYYEKRTLLRVEEEFDAGKSRPDLVVRKGTGRILVEVKNWRISADGSLRLALRATLRAQMAKYLALGLPVRLEWRLKPDELIPLDVRQELAELAAAAKQELEIVGLYYSSL